MQISRGEGQAGPLAAGQGEVWALAMLPLLGLVLMVAAACGSAAAPPTGQGEPAPVQSGNDKGEASGTLVAARGASGSEGAAEGKTAPKGELVGQFFCYVETLTADRPSEYGYLAPRGCQPSGAFKRGERMVFRFQVLDVAAGSTMTPAEAAGVKVRLPFVGDMDADFKQRGEGKVPDAPWTWDFCWDVPPDYPLGTLDYSIVISAKDGRSGVWKPPALVDPSRGIDSRPQITE